MVTAGFTDATTDAGSVALKRKPSNEQCSTGYTPDCSFDKRKISLSRVIAGQDVGIREVADKIWLVSFMEFDLGFFDEEDRRVEPACNPFVPKL